ncbi:hypothetical protein VUR80DRAFT_7977 [Thermomyces stellatus]
MKITQTLVLALAASGTAAAQDAPCTNEACTSLCRITPSCLSTLFDPKTGLCYTFSCVLNNYSKPSKFLGYQKPGADYECPDDQPVPGEPTSPPPDLVVPSEAPPPAGAETSTERIGGASPTLSTHGSASTAATATGGPSSEPTDGASDNEPDSRGDSAGDGDDEEPAAPTIDLPDAAGQLGFSAAMAILPLALLF